MTQEKEEEILGTSIVLYATELRKDLPKAGMRELYELCRRKFQDKFSIGRDQCYTISSSCPVLNKLTVHKLKKRLCQD